MIGQRGLLLEYTAALVPHQAFSLRNIIPLFRCRLKIVQRQEGVTLWRIQGYRHIWVIYVQLLGSDLYSYSCFQPVYTVLDSGAFPYTGV